MCILMMLEFLALGPRVFKGPSDFKEGLPLKDVWRSATTMSGALCVMTFGTALMLELLADSWDYRAQVKSVDTSIMFPIHNSYSSCLEETYSNVVDNYALRRLYYP